MWPGALHVFRWIILLAALAPFGYYVLAMIAARRFFGRPPALPRDFTPPVSILKPIKGLDREAYENYASFCSQDYPDYEVLFCVPDDSDPAIPVLQKVIAEHPHCRARLLIGAEELGTSKKVNKLVRLVREARHDFFVISDSDIRVAPDYLRSVVAHFSDSRVAAVTCLYRGLTDGSLPSVLEALGNSSDFAAGVLCAWLLGGVDFTLGATMATRRERLAEIGGFEALANHLTDDYELGQRLHARGYRVALADFPVCTVFPAQSLRQVFAHQVRWTMTLRVAEPWGHLGLIFAQGLPWAILAAAVAPRIWIATAYLAAYVALRFAMAWTVGARGLRDPLLRRKMYLLPLRDAFAFVVYVVSFFKRRIVWRDAEYYVRDRRLVPAAPRAPH